MIRKPGDLLGHHPFDSAGRAGEAACRSGDLTVLRDRSNPRTNAIGGPPARSPGEGTMPFFRSQAAARLLAATALCAAAAPAWADDTAAMTLPTVVLTGGFSPVEADAYGRAATVLTAEQLQQRGAATVQDALRAMPGVSVVTTGSSLGELRIRGGEARHAMILIDGVNAAGGDQPYNLGGLDLADVDRIEVLRGPQSVYYGSAAAAGVVNIITHKADASGGYARIEAGHGAAASLGQALVTDRLRLQFDGSYRDDDGYDVSYGDGGDKDGIRRGALSLSGQWQATDDLRLGFSARRADERAWFDGTNYGATSARTYLRDADFWSDRTERIQTLWAEAAPAGGRLAQRLSWEDSRVDVDAHDDYPRRTETRRRAIRSRTTLGLNGPAQDADQTLALALDRTRDDATGSTRYDRTSRSAALEYRGAYANGLVIQLGLRRDDNSDFAGKTSWAAGLSWRIPDSALRLHASAGTGILNPQYYQLVGGYGTVGNPDLTPEENSSLDAGLEYSLPDGRGLIDVTWFRERLKDEIVYSAAPMPGGANYRNLDGTSRREGVEIAARYDLTDQLSVGAAYTYLDARNPDGSVAVRRPRHELGLNATLRTFGGRGWLSADLRHVADLRDTEWWHGWGNEKVTRLPDFTVVNIAASYDLTDKARLTARVNNLLDESYHETWGYGTQGRTAWVGVEQRW